MYTITDVEDALLQKLRSSAVASYARKIDTFVIESGDIEEQIRLLTKNLPAVLVVYGGSEYVHFPGRRQDRKMTFHVWVCAQSLRGEGEARRGGVGTYRMLEDVRAALTASRLGLDIEQLYPVRESEQINTAHFSAYSIEFQLSTSGTF